MTKLESIEDLQASIESSPFNAFCGFQILEVDKKGGRLVMRMPMRSEMKRKANSNQFHGGPIACLIDTAGCYACSVVLGHGVPTINFRTDYIRPAVNSDLVAVAQVRRAGRSVAVADIDVHDDSHRLIATGRATFSALAG